MTISLPRAVERYIAAVNSDNADAMAAGFAPIATVQDEGRSYEGASAISGWMAETKRKYGHTIQPVNAIARDAKTVVTATLTGNFQGSPLDLQFVFGLKDDSIISLEIH
jgi:hypothetical protein